MSSTFLRTLALLAPFTIAGFAACAGALTIDPFTTVFPPNPNLPATHPALLFVGNYCDGAACPPGAIVNQVQDHALQTGLSDVTGGNRLTNLTLQSDAEVLQLDPVAHLVTMTSPVDGEGFFQLRYGTAGMMHANLLADGATAFLIDVQCSSPALMKYVIFRVQVTSHWTDPNEKSAIWSRNIPSPGTVEFDFADFAGIDFTQVDEMTMSAESTLLPGISVTIGPIRTGGGATPTRATTWGRLKSIYR